MNGGDTTYYLYDALGQMAVEYSTEPPSSTGSSYLFADMLGSVRTITNDVGAVVECYDYLPFGRMLGSGVGGRGSCYPDPPDANYDSRAPQKFTGKERDAETGLDYFGARYLSSPQGRFITVDPTMESAVLQMPQSWNRYSYALNNPLRYIDPNGELWISSGDAKNPYSWVDQCQKDQTCYERIGASVGGNLRIYGASSAEDMTDYVANKNGMIDLNQVAANDDAQFVLKGGIVDHFASTEASAALFNATSEYAPLHAGDDKIFITSASLESGKGSAAHPRSHGAPNAGLDFRYMDRNGMPLRDSHAASKADVARMFSLFNSFRYWGFNQTVSGRPVFFHTGPQDVSTPQGQKFVEQHQNHGHVGIVERLRPPRR